MRRLTGLTCALVLPALLVACSDDGRELRAPSADQTTTIATTSTTAPVGPTMSFSSPAFGAGAPIPADHSCDGAGVSPPLAWAGLPEAVTELAITVTDPDASGFVHWVISGLDPATTGLAEGEIPEGAVEATNDGGTRGWTGPCPPSGTHTYVFALYALAEPLTMEPGLPGLDAAALVQVAATATASFTGTFTRD